MIQKFTFMDNPPLESSGPPLIESWILNCTFTGHSSQDKIRSVLVKLTQKKLIRKVLESGYCNFGVDTCSSTISKLSMTGVSVRFLDDSYENGVSELLLGWLEISDHTGLGYYNSITEFFNNKILIRSPQMKFPSWCSDTTSTMTGMDHG